MLFLRLRESRCTIGMAVYLYLKPAPRSMHFSQVLLHKREGWQAFWAQADAAHPFGMYPEEVMAHLQYLTGVDVVLMCCNKFSGAREPCYSHAPVDPVHSFTSLKHAELATNCGCLCRCYVVTAKTSLENKSPVFWSLKLASV